MARSCTLESMVAKDPEESKDVATLRRWEDAGGTWRIEHRAGETVTVVLCRCDGGEEIDRLVSRDPALRQYVEASAEVSAEASAETSAEGEQLGP
jgi:hypothetical protein